MATAVLVHGAWHGGWCWDRVVRTLRERGVPVVAPDLPGHGADKEPLTDLHGDAARVREVLEEADDDVVLVGHSYGGAVISEAGDHPAVRHMVFIAAFALQTDETCMSAAVTHSAIAGISWEGRPNLGDGFTSRSDGTCELEPSVAAACLYNDCDQETVAWAIDRLGPQPLENLGQPPLAEAWRHRPSTYVVCADDMAVHADLQRVMARRCDTEISWPTSHSPFLSRPDLVVDLVASLI